MILPRPQKMCNFLEWRGLKLVFKRCVVTPRRRCSSNALRPD